jgi:hypothetical protein
MKPGDIVMARPKLLKLEVDKATGGYRPIPGTVVFVHPTGRFYTLEFKFGKNIVRESFFSLPEQEQEIYENDRDNEREGRRRQDGHHCQPRNHPR